MKQILNLNELFWDGATRPVRTGNAMCGHPGNWSGGLNLAAAELLPYSVRDPGGPRGLPPGAPVSSHKDVLVCRLIGFDKNCKIIFSA